MKLMSAGKTPPSGAIDNDLLSAQERSMDVSEATIRLLNEDDVAEWTMSLSDERLEYLFARRFLPAFINLRHLYRERLSAQDIRKYARQTVRGAIYSNYQLERFVRDDIDINQLPNDFAGAYHVGPLKNLLELGRGVIIATFRFGSYPLLSLDLLRRGFSVTTLLISDKQRSITSALQENSDSTRFRTAVKEWRIENAHDPKGPFKLAASLRQNRVVVIYCDGNTGSDGPTGPDNRAAIRFIDSIVQVKTGVAQIAQLCGAPILPMITVAGLHSSQVHCGVPIHLEHRAPSAAISRDIMQQLYCFLEMNILKHPGQWQGATAFHRWSPMPVVADALPPSSERKQKRDSNRAIRYEIADEWMLVDDYTRKGVLAVHPSSMRSLYAPPPMSDMLMDIERGDALNEDHLYTSLEAEIIGPWINAGVLREITH